ncbi:hypothetical protein PM082_023304 [Marasmius tenuissimus]|nr:hypothetical protein PM082_023304 [Marasmius tenuissimus]
MAVPQCYSRSPSQMPLLLYTPVSEIIDVVVVVELGAGRVSVPLAQYLTRLRALFLFSLKSHLLAAVQSQQLTKILGKGPIGALKRRICLPASSSNSECVLDGCMEMFPAELPLEMDGEILKRVLGMVSFEKGMDVLKGSSGLLHYMAPTAYQQVFLMNREDCMGLVRNLSLAKNSGRDYARFIWSVYIQMGLPCKTMTSVPHPLYESSPAAMSSTAYPNHENLRYLQRALVRCRDTVKELVVDGTTYASPVQYGRVFTDYPFPAMTHLELPLSIFTANSSTRGNSSPLRPYSFVASNWASLQCLRIFIEETAYDEMFRAKQVNFTDFRSLTHLCLVFGPMMDRVKVREVLVRVKVGKTLRFFAVEWGKGVHIPFPLSKLTQWRFDDRVVMFSKFHADRLIIDSNGGVHKISEECRELLKGLVHVGRDNWLLDVEKKVEEGHRLPFLRFAGNFVITGPTA